MRLITNGCSFTKGVGTKDPSKSAFGKILSETWECSYFENLGIGSSSNKRIYRTTLNYISKIDGNDYHKYFFIIGWSHHLRTEMFFDKYFSYYQVTPNNLSMYKKFPFLYDKGEQYFKDNSTSIGETLESLGNIIALQSLFKSLGIKYLMFNAFSPEYSKVDYQQTFEEEPKEFEKKDWIEKVSMIPRNLFHMIDQKHFINFLENDFSMKSYLMDKKVPFTPWSNMHPLEDGHKLWAEYLDSYVKKENII